MIITMLCFRKHKDSAETLVSFRNATTVEGSNNVYPHQDTRIQSSEEEPTPSTKLDEGPLPEPNTGASGCETHESREGQTLQYTDETKQCQFREESEGLPPSLVTAIESPQCPHHTDKSLDLYCPSHQVPVCPVCASTTHLGCPLMQNLDDVLQEKSEQLWKFVHVLKEHERSLAALRRKVKAKLKSKDSNTDQVSEDTIQGGDHKAEAIKCPDHSQGDCNICRLLACHTTDAPSTSQEVSRGDSPCLWITLTASPGSSYNRVQLSPQSSPDQSAQTKSYGPMQHSSPGRSPTNVPAQKRRQKSRPQCDGPRGPALAKVLEVGDRVKRSRDADCRNPGTIIAIPSIRTSTRDGDTSGLVDVRWDAGGEGSYRMGRHNHYELELA